MKNDLMVKNEIIENNIKIENMIYIIRGVQVMLDFDLAMIYECKNGTKSINLAVKRHPNRFPERYMFQLTDEEYNNLRFHSETTISKMSRTLREKIRNKKYQRLNDETKNKLINNEELDIYDNVKNPIIINTS